MKSYSIFIVCFFYVLSTSLAVAEYYQFIDKDGIKHYTDDISEIPKDQRPDVNIYKSYDTSPKPVPAEEKAEKTDEVITAETLMIQKNQLVEEHDALIKKRDALSSSQKTLDPKQHEELTKQLNLEINRFNEKKKAYDNRVEQYNEQIPPPKKD